MNDYQDDSAEQQDLFEAEETRTLLDQLLQDSRLYKHSKDYKDLLDFVVRLRDFAPYNAMLLQIQKPGLRYAASARDWHDRFGRTPKEGARPLLILWPFGPVALVYDVIDTEGKELPEDVAGFVAHGEIDGNWLQKADRRLGSKRIELSWIDAGDSKAGLIRVVKRAATDKEATQYRILVNRNHEPPVQLATLTHELGHLFLGHLGADPKLKIRGRSKLSHAQREIEAESVAYIVCMRNGVRPKSQTYLAGFLDSKDSDEKIDTYRVTHAAGKVEESLGLAVRSRFVQPKSHR